MRIRPSILPWPRPRGGPHRAVCHFCDTLHVASPLPEGRCAKCVRCDAMLYQNRPASLARTTAFSLTSLILMIVAHCFPFLTMDAAMMRTELTLVGASLALMKEGSPIVGVAVGLFTVVTPLLVASSLVYVCGPLMWGRAAPGAMRLTRWVHLSEPWNMIEVFLLGVLVSLLKLGKLADLHFGIGFWAFGALMFCMAAAVAAIDRHELWDRLEVAKG